MYVCAHRGVSIDIEKRREKSLDAALFIALRSLTLSLLLFSFLASTSSFACKGVVASLYWQRYACFRGARCGKESIMPKGIATFI